MKIMIDLCQVKVEVLLDDSGTTALQRGVYETLLVSYANIRMVI